MTTNQVIVAVSAATIVFSVLEWFRVRLLRRQYLDIQQQLREREQLVVKLKEHVKRLLKEKYQ